MGRQTNRYRRRVLLAIAGMTTLLAPTSRAFAPDLDGDGVLDPLDECSNTPSGVLVNAAGRPLGDLDGDCDADLADFDLFSQSVTGPLPPWIVEVCDDGADNDDDQLVDCADVEDCPLGSRCANELHCSQEQTCGCPSGLGDCDGLPGNGCETVLDNNPVCAPPFFLDNLSGDTGAGQLQIIDSGEHWYRVRLTEDSDGEVYLSATVQLMSATDTDYDLYLRCAGCVGAPVASSTSNNAFDYLYPRWNDDFGLFGEDDSLDIIIEVRWAGGGCGDFTLTVYGNTNLDGYPNTCNP